jgi:hypothetical protein
VVWEIAREMANAGAKLRIRAILRRSREEEERRREVSHYGLS